MKNFQVRVGGFYVNESKELVREITHEDGRGNVHWRSYELRSGQATGDSLVCSISRILQWADREAAPDEAAKMQRSYADLKEKERVDQWVDIVLRNIPDDRLLAEVRSRGHRVI